ncbi:hypothetical protein EKN77_13635 [Enterobacter hormaechei]|nr:hypothetical protein [Enterobacter hormaechei]RTN85852.1 hypothetical protein EKN77_13635 [Enterobacter hormaechei]
MTLVSRKRTAKAKKIPVMGMTGIKLAYARSTCKFVTPGNLMQVRHYPQQFCLTSIYSLSEYYILYM